MAILNKSTDNVLYTLYLLVRKRGASVIFDRLLHLGAVLNGFRLLQGVLWIFLIVMLVLGSISLDISRDRQINMHQFIVLVKGDATK